MVDRHHSDDDVVVITEPEEFDDGSGGVGGKAIWKGPYGHVAIGEINPFNGDLEMRMEIDKDDIGDAIDALENMNGGDE